MTTTLAVAGKGGTGKTAISALLIYFLSKASPPILAVDGDPATNLHLALGLPLDEQLNTIGGIREYMGVHIYREKQKLQISEQEWLDLNIRQGLVRGEGFDLLSIGRSEGPGCYCAINHMLRSTLARLSEEYRFVVIDNEAGMEHISRQTTNDVDLLFIISNPTVMGVTVAARTQNLIRELRSNVKDVYLIINRASKLDSEVEELIKKENLKLLQLIEEDPYIGEFEAEGRPVIELPEDSPLKKSALEILTELRLVPSSAAV